MKTTTAAPGRRRHSLDPASAAGTLFPLAEARAPAPTGKNPTLPIWTENKAKFIERYLFYFKMITRGGIYIDGFAGPQDAKHPDSWAAKLVLESTPRWFTQFHLFDRHRRQIKELEQLKAAQPPRQKKEPRRTVAIYRGDFNEKIGPILEAGLIQKTRATFCLLDQWTFECQWQTLKTLSTYRSGHYKIELFYFLANGWLDRALAGVRNRAVPDAWWGQAGWEGLRGMRGIRRAQLIASRFEHELGYRSAKPYPIYERPTGGRVMYYMIHATDHPQGPVQMTRAYRNALTPRETPEQAMLELGLSEPPAPET
jgi:three-Cys-motif partner protein